MYTLYYSPGAASLAVHAAIHETGAAHELVNVDLDVQEGEILGMLGPSEHFGELSLIDGQPRSAHVIAVEDTQLIVLRREDFRRRIEESPALAWALLTALSKRLRRAEASRSAMRALVRVSSWRSGSDGLVNGTTTGRGTASVTDATSR